jgi:hypothetical protein
MTITCEHNERLSFKNMLHPTFGIITVSTGRFRIDKFDGEVTLTIMNANRSDEGRYKCVLSEFVNLLGVAVGRL